MTVLFNIFMRKTLTDDFWGLHKNINCVLLLTVGYEPFKRQFHKMVKHTQKIRREIADELLE